MDAHLAHGHTTSAEKLAGIKDRDAQAAVAALYAEAQRSRTALAEQMQRLEGERQALEARERRLTAEAQRTLAYSRDPKINAWIEKVATEPEPDPDSPEYIAYVARQHGLAVVKEFMGTIQDVEGELSKQRQEEEAKLAAEAEMAKNRDYIAEHIDDFRNPEVTARVKVLHQKHGFSVAEAHRISLIERAAMNAKDDAELKERAQQAARDRVKRGGRSDSASSEPPPGLTVEQRDEWYQAHPAAAAARLAKYRRGGVG